MTQRFTDIHHHIAYGLDDGPPTPEKMRAMLRHAAGEGIGRIVATPHIVPGVEPFDMERYRVILAEANDYSRKNGLGIEILEGGELLWTEQCCPFLESGRAPTLAGTNRVLVEFSPDVPYAQLAGAIARLNDCGYVAVLAHCERYRCIARLPARAQKLKRQMDVRFQINCRTVIRPAGFFEAQFVKYMLGRQLADAVATDAHNLSSRPARMRAAYDALAAAYDPAYAQRLTGGSVLFDQ